MDLGRLVSRLRENAAVLAAQVRGVDPSQARWKPAPEAWSILEVVNHLADEEARDFRTRLDLTLHRPGTPWPPIDPPAWAVEERYNERDLAESIARFEEERARSLAWLSGLEDPQWDRSYEHARMGTLSAGDLLTSWVGHDLIHVRQINRLHRAYLLAEVSPYRADYAGTW